MFQNNNKKATSANYGALLAILLWSFSASIFVYLSRIPTFQCVALTLGFAFITTVIKITRNKKWKQIMVSKRYWLIGIICLAINQIAYIGGFKLAPPEQVDLINYLWPIFVVVFSVFLPSEKLSFFHILAVLTAFFGIQILFLGESEYLLFSSKYLFGYLLALASAISWTVYTLYSRNMKNVPVEMIGLYCGFVSLINIGLHLNFEHFVMPTMYELTIIAFLGSFINAGSYMLWYHGVKFGNFQFLGVASYFTPILSVLWLVVFGFVECTDKLLIATFLIAFSTVIAGAPESALIQEKIITPIKELLPIKTS